MQSCIVAYETGILPGPGAFDEQEEMFTEVFPFFVMHWKDKNYGRVWGDVQATIKVVLEGLFGTKGS